MKSYKCIICGKKISPLYKTKTKDVNALPWDGGTVISHWIGYGSTHDSKDITFGLCDDCITKKIEEKLVVVVEK